MTIIARRDDTCLEIQVCDKGVGIVESELKHVFDAFFRGEGTQFVNGTGMGLYIVRRLVEACGGTIEIESVVNEGTTVTCRFPNM